MPKTQLGWIKYGGTKMLIKDDRTVPSSQEMADQLNQNYIVSAAKTRRANQGDPMHYRDLL